MKTLTPETGVLNPSRSFLIYGEPKSGKTTLALSVAEAVPTLLIAAEADGWQDAYADLSPKGQANLQVVTPENRFDLLNIVETVKEKKVRVVVVDSVTKVMDFFENSIKAEGGKNVNNGITQKLSLSAYGDLATLTIDFIKNLKLAGVHVILTAGCDKEKVELEGQLITRLSPLFTGGKTGTMLPYEVRAICYLQSLNGKRQLWFEASQQWLAGTNYSALAQAKMLEEPTFIKIFSLFPQATKPVEPEAPKKPRAKKVVAEVPAEQSPVGDKVEPTEQAEEIPFLDEIVPTEPVTQTTNENN